MPAESADPASVIGDECHMVGPAEGSPRYDAAFPASEVDSSGNLLLLCKVHHKMVDDQPNKYSASYLKQLKNSHELRVKETLASHSDRSSPDAQTSKLRIIGCGREILNIVSGAYAYDFDHDEPRSQEEGELIANALQVFQDWGEVGDDIEAGQRVTIGYELSTRLSELAESGFVVLGSQVRRRMKLDNGTQVWPVAMIRIFRGDNPIFQQ